MIKKQIPNTITGFNLVSGCISIVLSFAHHYEWAIIAIFAAAVFDFFDGFAARLLKVSSPIGVEMDSLADVVSFGVAPAMILFCHMIQMGDDQEISGWQSYLPYVVFIVPMFSAFRLAKFNLDTRQTESFLGLPTPANALLLASLVTLPESWSFIHNPYSLLMIALITSCLLVSEIPLFSLKIKNKSWKDNKTKLIFLSGTVLIVALLNTISIPFVILWYLLLSIITNLYMSRKPN